MLLLKCTICHQLFYLHSDKTGSVALLPHCFDSSPEALSSLCSQQLFFTVFSEKNLVVPKLSDALFAESFVLV